MTRLCLPPLSLYVHIPWCVKKCPYCDFNSHERARLPERRYLHVLRRDLRAESALAQGRKLTSIFFGGGTPSLLSAATVAAVIDSAEKWIGLTDSVEITLEANPGTMEKRKFNDFHHAGINRLSLGIQSFYARQLQALGRIHSAEEARRAVATAQDAGFAHINIDLMHGLPQQTPAQALWDLQTGIALKPHHLSWYQLTIEPNTVFYRRPPPLPGADTLAEIQAEGRRLLADHGYRQYEVSAYSQPRHRARHNINYWQFGDYIGIGAGAHGKLTDPRNQRIFRTQKTRLPEHYLQGSSRRRAVTPVASGERPLEFLMNALRLTDGVPRRYFAERTGVDDGVLQRLLSPWTERGFIALDGDNIGTTPLGARFVDTILSQL